MFAIIKTGGKQYWVKPGDVIEIERLKGQEGPAVEFREVLLVDDGTQTLVGMPYLEKAVVRAEIIEEFKDDKVVVFKKKRRKQYKKKRGHRQVKTRVKILEVIPEAFEEKEPVSAEKPAVERPPVTEVAAEEVVAVSPQAEVVETKKPARAGRRTREKAPEEGEAKQEPSGPKRSRGAKKEG